MPQRATQGRMNGCYRQSFWFDTSRNFLIVPAGISHDWYPGSLPRWDVMEGTLVLGKRGNQKISSNLCFHWLSGSNVCSQGRTPHGSDLNLVEERQDQATCAQTQVPAWCYLIRKNPADYSLSLNPLISNVNIKITALTILEFLQWSKALC